MPRAITAAGIDVADNQLEVAYGKLGGYPKRRFRRKSKHSA